MQVPYEVVDKGILHFPLALSDPSEVLSFIENTNSAGIGDWMPWLSYGEVNPHQYGYLKELDLNKIAADSNQKISSLIEKIYLTLDECYLTYYMYLGLDEATANVYVDKFRKNRPSRIAIKKYFVGEDLGPHPDWESGDPVVFTASMYLNTDYIGGVLAFPEHGVSVEATPGSVVIFPSSYIHESTKVVSGTKYVTNVLAELPKALLSGLI